MKKAFVFAMLFAFAWNVRAAGVLYVKADATGDGDVTAPVYARFRSDALSDALALDCHLGAKSPAIDAGDPARDWSREPRPKGKRANLGFYGNTPWATRTTPGRTLILLR